MALAPYREDIEEFGDAGNEYEQGTQFPLGLDSFGDWRNASFETLRSLFAGDQDTMLKAFRMLFLANVRKDIIEEACQAHKARVSIGAEWRHVPVIDVWPAINEPEQAVIQPVTLILSRSIIAPAVAAVSVLGQFHIVQEFWNGAPCYVLGAVAANTRVPLPGAPGSVGGVPLLQTQIVLGSGSQAPGGDFSTTAMYGGFYQIPALQTPPPVDSSGDLPPYGTAWANNNYLFVPGYLTPITSPINSAQSSASYNSVLVSMDAQWQPNASMNLANAYETGRMLLCRGLVQVNSSATGIVSTGSGTVGQVNSVAIAGATQAWIRGQDSKAAETNQLSGTYAFDKQGGLVFGQGTQVISELQVVNYYLTSGNSAGGKKLNFDQVTLYASGISGSTNGNIYQCTTPAQATGPGPFTRNGVCDVQTGAFANVRFYSAAWNISMQYAQQQQLLPSQVQIGNLISNVYPQSIFSSANCNSYSTVVRVGFDPLPQNLLPTYVCKWQYSMGMTSSGDVGYMVHIFGQIRSDGTMGFYSQFEGMGCVGKTMADPSNSISQPFGIIPAGMRNSYMWTSEVEFPRITENGVEVINTAWTYLGSLAFLLAFPNAIVDYSCEVIVPQLYLSGAILPAAWCMLESLQPQQNLMVTIGQTWQVVANAATRTTQYGISGLSHPPMSRAFSDFLRMAFKDSNLNWFSNSDTMQTFYQKIATVMQVQSPDDMWRFFADLKVLRTESVAKMLLHHSPHASGHFLSNIVKRVMQSGIASKIGDAVLPQIVAYAEDAVSKMANQILRKRSREEETERTERPRITMQRESMPQADSGIWSNGPDMDYDEDDEEQMPQDSQPTAYAAAGYLDKDGKMEFFPGSLNGRDGSGFRVPGACWINIDKFGLHQTFKTVRRPNKKTEKVLFSELDMSHLLASFSNEDSNTKGGKFTLIPLVEFPKRRQRIWNIVAPTMDGLREAYEVEVKMENELKKTSTLPMSVYRTMNVYLIDEKTATIIPTEYGRKTKLPFNQGLILYQPPDSDEQYPLSNAAINKIFGPRFREMREYLKIRKHALSKKRLDPAREATEHERTQAFDIADGFVERLRNKIIETMRDDNDLPRQGRKQIGDSDIDGNFMLTRVLSVTNTILLLPPENKSRRYEEGVFTQKDAEDVLGKRLGGEKHYTPWLPSLGLGPEEVTAIQDRSKQRLAGIKANPLLQWGGMRSRRTPLAVTVAETEQPI